MLIFVTIGLSAFSLLWFEAAHDGMHDTHSYTVIHTYPHDPSAFTQGLTWFDGQLIEGTGLYGQSTIRKVSLTTGEVTQTHSLSSMLFGEGVTVMEGLVYQLTWKNGLCMVYDVESFEEVRTFHYNGEGWGLTHNGKQLIMSDGSSTIIFIDPTDFTIIDSIDVFDGRYPVTQINELEYVDGVIYANIWQTNQIIGINPNTGEVLDRIDFSELKDKTWSGADVLNGIAYDSLAQRLFITGKLWPVIYEIKLVK
jgi:glutamine cyclotransferase